MNNSSSAEYYEVSELNRKIKTILDEEVAWVKVKGELASFTSHRTGHWYFTLKDTQGQLEGVVFKNFVRPELSQFQVGDYVYGIGVLTSYIKTGRLSFQAFSISPKGRGTSIDSLREMRERLEQEGVFAKQKALPLPQPIQHLAIITSLHAAALGDILATIKQRIVGKLAILIIPTLMQGEKASSSIITALQASQYFPKLQAVLLSRGGGAYGDLWEYNSEPLARAISLFPLPIVSAIGHEKDYTLCDFASHSRYATPSIAAGELFIDKKVYRQQLNFLNYQLRENSRSLLLALSRKMQEWQYQLSNTITQRIQKYRLELQHLRHILSLLDPDRLSSQGYILTKYKGKPYKGYPSLKEGDILELQTSKNSFLVQVIQKSSSDSR